MDLQLPYEGSHVGESRVAAICGGDRPSVEEAAHLSGCDPCLDLLLAVSEGFARLRTDRPECAAVMADLGAPRPSRAAGRALLSPRKIAAAVAGAAVAALIWLGR